MGRPGAVLLQCILCILLFGSFVTLGRVRPRNVHVEVVNSTSIVIRWQPPLTDCPPENYVIRLKEEGTERSEVVKVDGTKKGVIIGNLNDGATYSVRLKAHDCNGKGSPSRWVKVHMHDQGQVSDSGDVRTDDTQPPGKPTFVKLRSLSNSVVMQWKHPTDNIFIKGYIVGYGENVPDVNWLYVGPEQQTYTLRNLKPGTLYVISLRAFNEMGKGPVLYELINTKEETETTGEPFTPPVNLEARILSPTSAWLQWTDPTLGRGQQITDERCYYVNYRSLPEGKYQGINIKALYVTLENLTPYTRYEFKVKTINGGQSSPFSETVINRTSEIEPETPPVNVMAALKNESTAVLLSWQEPEKPNGRITDYLVLYTTNPMLPNRNWNVKAVDGLRAAISPLNHNSTYYFKVQARNAIGISPMSSTVVIRTPPGKDKPVGLAQRQELQLQLESSENINVSQREKASQLSVADTLPAPVDSESSKSKRMLGVGNNTPFLADDQPMQWEFTTALQHRVSAVVSWKKDCKDVLAEFDDSKMYMFQYYSLDDPGTRINITTWANLVLLDGLKPNKRYGYRVKTIREGGKESNWSGEGFVNTEMLIEN